jgi:hypothetical protein
MGLPRLSPSASRSRRWPAARRTESRLAGTTGDKGNTKFAADQIDKDSIKNLKIAAPVRMPRNCGTFQVLAPANYQHSR